MGICKIFLGRRDLPSGEKLYLVGQTNPPLISPIPASAVEAMHKVINGEMPDDAAEGVEDLDAIDLLLPFASDFEILPINPGWRLQ